MSNAHLEISKEFEAIKRTFGISNAEYTGLLLGASITYAEQGHVTKKTMKHIIDVQYGKPTERLKNG